MDNQQSYWYTGQLVTAAQMTDYSQDVYTRFTQLTQQQVPCILTLNLSALTQVGANVNVPAGAFRFNDTTYAFLPYNTGIFGNAPAAVVAVSGNGFIVARYSVTPTSTNQTNYTFPTQYLFVTTINPITDVVVCNITTGVISATGKFFNYFPDIIDTSGLVSIIGTNGLSVTNNTLLNGELRVKQFSSFMNDGTSAIAEITRDSATLLGAVFRIITEGPSSIVPGATHVGAIVWDDGSGPTPDPGLFAAYGLNHRLYNNSTPGDVNPTVHTNAIATLGDMIYGFPSVPFTIGAADFRINGVNLFPTASSGFSISGVFAGVSCTGGTITTRNIDLIANNIITSIRSYSNFGVANTALTPGLTASCTFNGQDVVLVVDNPGATVTSDIVFSIEI